VLNPHLDPEDLSRSTAEVRRLDRQYQKRQRYQAKYGRGSMRSLRRAFRAEKREDETLTFRAWLRSIDSAQGGTFSPKAAKIRAAA